MSLPSLNRKPSLVREWASRLPGVGVKKSEDAERVFKNARALANADESDFMRIPGVGVKTAQEIVKKIGGR